MRAVHISDIHLGYRAYNRINRAGLNAREADVFAAFRDALDKAADLNPDIILIAGDLFHIVRPSNLMIEFTFRQFAALKAKTNAPIVIIGGNHDSPRSSDTGCILDLFANLPGIYVAHSEYQQLKFDDIDTSVFCLCHRALNQLSNLKIEPDPNSKHNILMVHGTVEGVIRNAYDIFEIKRADVISDKWDYIAFGHYHCFEELAPNAFYSGSIEYTSTNIWSETSKSKGIIEYDLDKRKLIKFHEIKTRDAIDLRPIDASDLTASEINIMVEKRVEGIKDGHDNKIVRLIIENLPRTVQADIDFSYIRKIRSEALHFELQIRPPAKISRNASSGESLGQFKTLETEWDEFGNVFEIPAGVEREKFLTIGRDYLMKFKE